MKTVSEVSKYLAKRKATYEKNLASPIESERNAAHRMIKRVEGKIDELFNYQESTKSPVANSGVPEMKWGGFPNQMDSIPRNQPVGQSFFQETMYLPDHLLNDPNYSYNEKDLVKEFMSPRTSLNPDDTKVNIWNIPKKPVSPIKHPYRGDTIPKMANRSAKLPIANPNMEKKAVSAMPPLQTSEEPGVDTPQRSGRNKIGDFGLGIAPYLAEFATRNNAINRMQKPPEPTALPPIHLNTALDTGADENMAKRMMRTRQLNAERYAPNSQALMGEFGKATADTTGFMNQLSQQRNNHRAQMENAQVGANHQITSQNAMMMNQHNAELNQFLNEKIGAKAGNSTNLMQKISMAVTEGKMKDHDLKRLRIMISKYPADLQKTLLGLLNPEQNTNE